MGRLGMTEILVILVVVVLLFGARKFADLGKGLGEGIRNFKKGIKEEDAAPPKQLTTGKDVESPAQAAAAKEDKTAA